MAVNDPKIQKCDELAYSSNAILCKAMISAICKTIGKVIIQSIIAIKRLRLLKSQAILLVR